MPDGVRKIQNPAATQCSRLIFYSTESGWTQGEDGIWSSICSLAGLLLDTTSLRSLDGRGARLHTVVARSCTVLARSHPSSRAVLTRLTELVQRAGVPGLGRGDAAGWAPVREGLERRRALRAVVSWGRVVVNQNARLPREAITTTGIRRGRPTRAIGIAMMADQRATVIIP